MPRKNACDFDDEETASFHRLYAPTASHTIQPIGRFGTSCHNHPLAIGYSRGELTFDPQSKKWSLSPEYANSLEDGLPQDAWIGFLEEVEEPKSTHTYTRPFNVEEQKRILMVGAYLTCHKDTEQMMQEGIIDFKEVYDQRVPVWND